MSTFLPLPSATFPPPRGFITSCIFPPLPNRLDPLAPLPGVSRLQRIPPIDTAALHTHHLLVQLHRPEVRHALRLCLPWVPHHNVREHIAGEFEAGFSIFNNGDWLGGVGGVDTVGLGGNFDGGFGGRRGAVFGDFVVIRGGFEAGDGGVVNVLRREGQCS